MVGVIVPLYGAIQKHLVEKQLTMSELCKLAGVSWRTVRDASAGFPVGDTVLDRIAAVLNTTRDALVDLSKSAESDTDEDFPVSKLERDYFSLVSQNRQKVIWRIVKEDLTQDSIAKLRTLDAVLERWRDAVYPVGDPDSLDKQLAKTQLPKVAQNIAEELWSMGVGVYQNFMFYYQRQDISCDEEPKALLYTCEIRSLFVVKEATYPEITISLDRIGVSEGSFPPESFEEYNGYRIYENDTLVWDRDHIVDEMP